MKLRLEHRDQVHDFTVSDELLKEEPELAIDFILEQIKMRATQLIEWPEGMDMKDYAAMITEQYKGEE